jgi:hypothetical protein
VLKIVSISNETHEVTLRHEDGEVYSFVVPEASRIRSSDKMAYIKSQSDAQEAIKATKTKRAQRKPYILYAIMVAETLVIFALLMRH